MGVNPLTSQLKNIEQGNSLPRRLTLLNEKAQQKVWHNNKVEDKDLDEGCMALFFLQTPQATLKLCGIEEPFVITGVHAWTNIKHL